MKSKRSMILISAATFLALLVIIYVSLSAGERVVMVVLPRGVAHMPYTSNYWPPSIKVVINVNNTVKWVNLDDHMHTVTDMGWLFHSGELNMYDTFTYTFTKPGTYSYQCLPHPWMRGYVNVIQP